MCRRAFSMYLLYPMVAFLVQVDFPGVQLFVKVGIYSGDEGIVHFLWQDAKTFVDKILQGRGYSRVQPAAEAFSGSVCRASSRSNHG
jgi:hypothetical protein